MKLDSEHIRFVMDSLQKNTTEVRNMKQYLLAVLFNAPTTISNHYTAQVNHDICRRLVNSRFSAARIHREKGFCHETTPCLHYGSLEQQPV